MSRRNDYGRSTSRTTRLVVGRQRSSLGYWIPLGITVLAVTAGLAAWIWSERQEEYEDDSDNGDESHTEQSLQNGDVVSSVPSSIEIEEASISEGMGLGRAGPEVDKAVFEDHQTWQEEADARALNRGNLDTAKGSSRRPGGAIDRSSIRRKTVALVLSVENDFSGNCVEGEEEEEYHYENTSMLSHLATNVDFDKVRVLILIHAPKLKRHPLNTAHDEIEDNSASQMFNTLWAQAQTMVEKETMVFPFTVATSYIQILRQLKPDFVYLQESLAGTDGDAITQLQTWMRRDVVLVVGANGEDGGLADSESEEQHSHHGEHWWQKEERVGRGRGVVVVEGARLGDDFTRRVYGN